jgi:4-amino-4-deoxy-L-arabinose transferase-like glycosyltransferase
LFALWGGLAVIVLVGLVLRAVSYTEDSRPKAGAGLAAVQGEMARNIVDHGRWFVVNQNALDFVSHQQNEQGKLIDPSEVDYSRLDQGASFEPQIQQMPGLAPVLAGLWWVTGRETYSSIQWLQILLDSGMIVVVYWIALTLTASKRVSIFAALFYAISPGAIVVAKRPMIDTWAGFFVIACLAVFLWARKRPERTLRLIPLGILTGLGLYFRPFIIILPVALALVATPQGGWRKRFVWVALPTVLALIVFSPWTIRNFYEFHRFIPARTGLGQAVYDGLGANDESARALVHSHHPDVKYGSPAYDDFLLRQTGQSILDHPGHFLGLVVRRARFLLPCLLVLVIWRRWRRQGLILVAVATATIAPYLLIGSEPRFYLPAGFTYLILISMACEIGLAVLLPRWFAQRPTGDGSVVASREPGDS